MMKRTLLRLVFCLTLVLFSCENDNSATEVEISQTKNVLSAKKWFKDYKANEEFHPAFKNIDYYWENATVTQLENSSIAIAVPMKDNPENSDYKGKKMLYLYPTDHGYEAVVHEIFPKLEDASYLENKKEDFKNLDTFNGYILTWDLKEGFVKGAEFENGSIIKNISFAQIFSENKEFKNYNMTHKAPAAAPIELDNVSVTGGTGGGGCGGCGGVIRFTPTLGGGSIGGGTGGYIGSLNGGGSIISAPTTVQIIDALTGKAKCINGLLNQNGNSFVQKLLTNFTGTSKYDIKLLSQEKVFNKDANGIIRELNGKTTYEPNSKIMNIEISTSRVNGIASLEVSRIILHEYIHADMYRKISLMDINDKSQEVVDFKTTYDAYEKNQHSTMAILYLNSMKEALKEFHKTILKDDYNMYIKYYGEEPNDIFYEALAWGGLQENNVKAWADLPDHKKTVIQTLASRVSMLSKTVPCSN